MTDYTLIQKRQDTAANWTSADTVLSIGEEGFETDTSRTKIGDGSTAWTDLPYTDAQNWDTFQGLIKGAVNALAEGVVGDGSTNDTAAIGALLSEYAGDRDIRFPAANYALGEIGETGANRIVIPSDTHVICDRGSLFTVNQRDDQSGVSIFYAGGSDGTKVALDADNYAADQTLTLPSGYGAGFSYGDIVGVESTVEMGYYLGAVDNKIYGRELRRVVGVSGDVLSLDAKLEMDYLVGDSAVFWKLSPVSNVTMDGMTFVSGPGVDPYLTGASAPCNMIKAEKTLNVVLSNISVHNTVGGIVIQDGYDTVIDNYLADSIPNFADPYTVYGLVAAGSTTNMVVDNMRARDVRHAFTTTGEGRSGPTTYWGGPQHVQINNGIGYGSPSALTIWDTHEAGRHIHFNNCMAIGGGEDVAGFQIRCKDVTITNPRIINCGYRGITINNNSAARVKIVGGEIAYSGDTGIAAGGPDIQILGTRIHHSGQLGVTGPGISISNTTDIVIDGVIVEDNLNVGIVADTSTTVNPVIKNSVLPYSATQGLSITHLPADMTLSNCVCLGHGAGSAGLYDVTSGAKINNVITDSGVYSTVTLLDPLLSGYVKDANNKNLLRVIPAASAVNYLQIGNGNAGGDPGFSTNGSDTNVNLSFVPKGAGVFRIWVTTGNTPTIEGTGADAAHNLNLKSKGTGVVQANGVQVATVSGSLTTPTVSTSLTLADAANIIANTTTGSKIGTATGQKLGFWNATPAVQPTTAVAEGTFVENSGGTAVNVDSTFDGYTLQQVVKALRNIGLLA